MLGYVSQEKYEEEMRLRIAAEERARLLAEQNVALQSAAEAERVRSAELVRELLDRFAPLPAVAPSQNGGGGHLFSSKDLYGMPAFGKGDILRRNAAARAREREELSEEDRAAWDARHRTLTDEERKGLSVTESEALNGILERVFAPGKKEEEAES
jgi:hypothetical protein